MLNLNKSTVFNTLEEVADYPHEWETDFRAIKPGNNKFLLQETLAPALAVRCGTFFGPSIHLGTTPAGTRTFYFLLNPTNDHYFMSQPAASNDLMAFGKNGVVDTASGGPSIHCTVSISEDYFSRLSDSRDTTANLDSCTKKPLLSGTIADVTEAITHLTYLEQNPDLCIAHEQALQQETLAMALLKNLEEPSHNESTPRNGHQLISKALDYIRCHSERPIRVTEVCKQVNVSVRTLELYFRRYLNTTPKMAIQQLRLSHLRKRLISRRAGLSTVSQISFECGYTHLSQLAQDYYKAFGELPSETLGRTKNGSSL